MKVVNSGNFANSKNTVIIVKEGAFPEGLSDAQKGLCAQFMEQEEDCVLCTDLNTSTVFIKHDENAEKMRMAGAKALSKLGKKVESIGVVGGAEATFAVVEGLLLTNYQFIKYFSDADKKRSKLDLVIVSKEVSEDLCAELQHIQKAVAWARDMVNEPVSYLTAEQLSEEIKMLGKDAGFSVNVLEKSQIESLKMGGLLAVNKGSIDPPTFNIMEYKGENAVNAKPLVLVGKGVVYDTGGLSLKPTPNSMDIMKSDMGGAACVAGAVYLAALQKLPIHVVALIPATDNRPGLNAYAPGDVVKMYNGKTVEVLNTDAEGRMILADALSYSGKYDPELVVDAATLTGAAHRAIGAHASIIMGNADDKYFEQLDAAGNEVFERVVRFPFWEEYGEEMKSPIADLKNLGGPSAGMITAGKFLENFVEAPYVHMDIAGPAWLDRDAGYRTKGGSGVGVRLLYQFMKNYK